MYGTIGITTSEGHGRKPVKKGYVTSIKAIEISLQTRSKKYPAKW
jgi:hypothetical protein